MEDNPKNDYKYALCLVDISTLGTKTFSYLIPDDMKNIIKIKIIRLQKIQLQKMDQKTHVQIDKL